MWIKVRIEKVIIHLWRVNSTFPWLFHRVIDSKRLMQIVQSILIVFLFLMAHLRLPIIARCVATMNYCPWVLLVILSVLVSAANAVTILGTLKCEFDDDCGDRLATVYWQRDMGGGWDK